MKTDICPCCKRKYAPKKIDWDELMQQCNRQYVYKFKSPVGMVRILLKSNTQKELCKIFNCCAVTLRKFCKDHGIEISRKPRKPVARLKALIPADKKMICEKCGKWFHDDDMVLFEGKYFCRKCKKAVVLISDISRNNEVTVQRLTGKSQVNEICVLRRDLWCQLADMGYTMNHIAMLFNRSNSTVIRTLQRYKKISCDNCGEKYFDTEIFKINDKYLCRRCK